MIACAVTRTHGTSVRSTRRSWGSDTAPNATNLPIASSSAGASGASSGATNTAAHPAPASTIAPSAVLLVMPPRCARDCG